MSSIDNVEYIVINNPAPGTYRLKVTPFNAPSFSLRYGLAAVVIRGDPTPPIAAFLSAPPNPAVGSTFAVTATVSAPSYLASAVQIEPTLIPLGVTLLVVQTTRADGVSMNFLNVADALTLGNVVSGLPRSATWRSGRTPPDRRPSRYDVVGERGRGHRDQRPRRSCRSGAIWWKRR